MFGNSVLRGAGVGEERVRSGDQKSVSEVELVNTSG